MKMCFVPPVLPQAVTRPIIRLQKPRTNYNTGHTDLTETMRRDACIADNALLQNLEHLDRGYDFDEFQDIDNEHEGLTITEPMSEVELFQFCTGYDIL
jgi:hypothetical protein